MSTGEEGGGSGRRVQAETGRGWDVVARAKYEAEFDDHLEQLKAGHHNLLGVELETLGPLLPGAHVVHLQCSHGFDALGLLNAGAASVVGVDISSQMIRQARAKAAALGVTSAEFRVADVLDLPADLYGTADLVYTGRGSLPWILDIERWGTVVARLLRPGGRIFVYEGHPLDAVWDRQADGPVLRADASYFNSTPAEAPGFPASVVEREVGDGRPSMVERQWLPGDVIQALLSQNLVLRTYAEHPQLFWNQFPNWPEDLLNRLPHSYSVVAEKTGDQPQVDEDA